MISTKSTIWKEKLEPEYDKIIEDEAKKRGYTIWTQWPAANMKDFWSFHEETLKHLASKYGEEINKSIHLRAVSRNGRCHMCIGNCKYV